MISRSRKFELINAEIRSIGQAQAARESVSESRLAALSQELAALDAISNIQDKRMQLFQLHQAMPPNGACLPFRVFTNDSVFGVQPVSADFIGELVRWPTFLTSRVVSYLEQDLRKVHELLPTLQPIASPLPPTELARGSFYVTFSGNC